MFGRVEGQYTTQTLLLFSKLILLILVFFFFYVGLLGFEIVAYLFCVLL